MKPAKQDPHATLNAVMRHLRKCDCTVLDCAQALGIGRTSAWRAMNQLHKLGLIHIPRMRRQNEDSALESAVYAWGEGVDVSAETLRSRRQNAVSSEPDPVPFVKLDFWHTHVFAPISTNAGHAPAGRI